MEADYTMTHEEFEEVLSRLQPEDAEKMRSHQRAMLENSKKAATAAIMARNLSHGIGNRFKQ